jgi:hypothetical protein
VQNYRESKGASFCYLLDFQGKRMEPRPHSFHKEHIMFLRGREKRAQFCSISCNRFFAENILSRLYGTKSISVMVCVWGSWRLERSETPSFNASSKNLPMYTASTSCKRRCTSESQFSSDYCVTYLICVYSLVRSVSLDRFVPASYSIDELLSTLDTTRSDSSDLVYYIMNIATETIQCDS